MKNEEIDDVLKKAAHAPHKVDVQTLHRIAGSIQPTLRPVRPLPPPWVMTGGLVLICAVVAIAGAARAGFYGITRMGLFERALIFSLLFVLAWSAGIAFVHEMIPGSRRRIATNALLVVLTVLLEGIFALCFRDYQTSNFFSAGVACLVTGLLFALPAGVLAWLLLHRGYAINRPLSGMAAGTVAGLAGLGMLELHCPNFQATHVLVWHIAVVPLSGVAGALVAWMRSSWASSDHRKLAARR